MKVPLDHCVLVKYVSNTQFIRPEDISAWLNHDRRVEFIMALGTCALLVDRGYTVEVLEHVCPSLVGRRAG